MLEMTGERAASHARNDSAAGSFWLLAKRGLTAKRRGVFCHFDRRAGAPRCHFDRSERSERSGEISHTAHQKGFSKHVGTPLFGSCR